MKITCIIGAAAMLVLGAGAASAMPTIPSPAAGDGTVMLVRQGCGFGAHRGPYGGCRLNRGPRGAIRGLVTGRPGGCPPGRHRGPYGGCRRNAY